MAISAKDVMSLRKRTGLGMMECKAALEECGGDADQAVELLRSRAKGKMDERTDRDAAEGVIAVAKNGDGLAVIELLSETDFAARNDTFVDAAKKIAELSLQGDDGEITGPTDEMTQLIDNLRITIKENISLRGGVKLSGDGVGAYVHHNGKIAAVVQTEGGVDDETLTGLCQHVVAVTPTPVAVDEAGLPADEVAQQKQQAIQEAKDTGKPDNIAEKIAEGKLRKWVDENTLLGQIYVREMDAKKPVRDYLPKGAKITNFWRFKLGG